MIITMTVTTTDYYHITTTITGTTKVTTTVSTTDYYHSTQQLQGVNFLLFPPFSGFPPFWAKFPPCPLFLVY